MQIDVTNAECSPTPVPLPPPPVQPCVGGGTVPDPVLLPHVLPANTPKGTRQRPGPNLQSEGLGDPPQPKFKWSDLCGTSMPPIVSCIPRSSNFGWRGEAATLRVFLRKAYPVSDQLSLPVIRVRSMRVHEVRVANTRKFFLKFPRIGANPPFSMHRSNRSPPFVSEAWIVMHVPVSGPWAGTAGKRALLSPPLRSSGAPAFQPTHQSGAVAYVTGLRPGEGPVVRRHFASFLALFPPFLHSFDGECPPTNRSPRGRIPM